MGERYEPNESRVRIKRFAPRWTIPEGIETNRESSSEVGIRIREVLIGRGEHAGRDHLLELPLLVLLLLQVHGNDDLLCLNRGYFSREAQGAADGES